MPTFASLGSLSCTTFVTDGLLAPVRLGEMQRYTIAMAAIEVSRAYFEGWQHEIAILGKRT